MLAIAPDLACQELVELVTEYLEGGLDELTLVRFERHLAECPFCQTYVEQIRATIELAGRVDAEQMSPSVRQGLLDAFSGWNHRQPESG